MLLLSSNVRFVACFELFNSTMESLSMNHLISGVYSSKFSARYSSSPEYTRRIGTRYQQFRLVVYSQKWDFKDFQGHVKPKRLLPASKLQISAAPSIEHMIDYFKKQSSECLYKARIQTSSLYGSGLTDVSAGVLLSLVDENGDSILQRIPTCVAKNHFIQSHDNANFEIFHFERAGVDEFMFEGPALGKLAAVWICIESGQWRIKDLTLTVIHQQQHGSGESGKKVAELFGLQYKFELEEDILVGEGSDVSMIDLRPHSVTEFSEEDISTFLTVKDTEPPSYSLASSSNSSTSNEESLKEYADLKSSLLLYDALLILGGSLIDYVLAGESAAFAFLTGGTGGFLYLLLLQISVDELPGPELVSTTKWDNKQMFGKLKGSVSKLVLAFSVAIVVVSKCISPGEVLTQEELIWGMIGFLMCKVSVVFAAFKPNAIRHKTK